MDAERETFCREAESKNFSSAFWWLVEHDTDVSGFVAYGLYKYHKISKIQQDGIDCRRNEALDRFGVDPYLAEVFKELADNILDEANGSVSTTAVVSAQSKQLADIASDVRKKNFWRNVGASATATILLAVFLPIIIGFLNPDLRQSIGLWIIDSSTALFIDTPTTTIDHFVAKLEARARQAYVVSILKSSGEEAVDPTFVLGAVVDNLDRRPAKDDVILHHLRESLKRAENPLEIAEKVYLQEIKSAAPPKSLEDDGLDQEDAIPNFDTPVPKLRPAE